ncbi:hypothetical protein BH10PSE6_BH10PSE6_16440 [soil metagenome]
MRSILVAFLMLGAAPLAQAQTPEDRAYVAARGQAVATLEATRKSLPPPIDESTWLRAEQAARAELKARLQDVLARVPLPKDFSIIGSNPDPLCCGATAGSLDSLLLSNGRVRAVMTTEGILRLWLGGRDPRAALESDDIDYHSALNADALVRDFAPLPVAKPTGADLAIGRLVIKGQDSARLPLHIVVAVIRNGVVYLSLFPASLEAADATTPCDVLWGEASERYRSADDIETRRDINALTGEQLEHCVKAHEGQPLFPGLGRRAQRTVNALAAD